MSREFECGFVLGNACLELENVTTWEQNISSVRVRRKPLSLKYL